VRCSFCAALVVEVARWRFAGLWADGGWWWHQNVSWASQRGDVKTAEGGYEQGQQTTDGAANGQADDESRSTNFRALLLFAGAALDCSQRPVPALLARCSAPETGRGEAKSAENQLSNFHGVIERQFVAF
jgi:hypothetical protein